MEMPASGTRKLKQTRRVGDPSIAHSIHSCKKEFIYNIAKAFVPTNTHLEIWNLHQHHNEGMDYENQPAAHGVTNFSELENVHCDSQLLGFHP